MSADKSTQGFLEDCTALLAEFASHKSPKFENFCAAWKLFNFQYIFYGHEQDPSLVQFTDDALIVLKHLFLNAESQLDGIGALYMMYTMYFKQPTLQYCKFRCTQAEWHEFRRFYESLGTPRFDQARLIFWKLVRADAFRHVECEHECGFEQFLQRDQLRSRTANQELVFRSVHSSIGSEMRALRDPSDGLLPVLTLLQAGYNEMKEHLDGTGQLLGATNVMEDISAGIGKIEKIFKIESTAVKREQLLLQRRQQVADSAADTKTVADQRLEELTNIGERRQRLKAQTAAKVPQCAGTEAALESDTGELVVRREAKKRCYLSRHERALKMMTENLANVRRVYELEESELLRRGEPTAAEQDDDSKTPGSSTAPPPSLPSLPSLPSSSSSSSMPPSLQPVTTDAAPVNDLPSLT